MEQKFFFFDIDNTLAVWPEGKIPESAQYSLDELKRRGHRVALAMVVFKWMLSVSQSKRVLLIL